MIQIRLKSRLWRLRRFKLLQPLVKRLEHVGWKRYCPVCERHFSHFDAFSVSPLPPRADAQCPNCGALERDRFAYLILTKRIKSWDRLAKPLLHVAPEPVFHKLFRQQLAERYVTADLNRTDVDIQMDITKIPFPNEYFGAIYCSHVLEHVVDDRIAIKEFRRVLERNGWALLNVPITAEMTFEDPTVTEPQERLRLFGQEDHVRRYGADFINRLVDAGFTPTKISLEDLLTQTEIITMGLCLAGDMFLCR